MMSCRLLVLAATIALLLVWHMALGSVIPRQQRYGTRPVHEAIVRKMQAAAAMASSSSSSSSLSSDDPIIAGVAEVDATLPIGVPLAGFNHGDRRCPKWPIPCPAKYTTFMMPSKGVMDTLFVRTLVISAGKDTVALVSFDGIGSDGAINKLAWQIAQQQGFSVPFDNVIFSGSHSHSCPGATSSEKLWELAPATDMLVPELQKQFASFIATSMVQAQLRMGPVQFGIGIGQLYNVTTNRRGHMSPYLKPNSVDTQLGVIAINSLDGQPLATLWNFAIHGVCYGPENMLMSGDIMGRANTLIERQIGGISLFVNADAGDIDPAGGMCNPKPAFTGSDLIAQAVSQVRSSLQFVTSGMTITAKSRIVDFGPTNLNLTLQRVSNCTTGGPLDICSICRVLNCDINLHLGSDWVENQPRFTAIRFDTKSGKRIGIVSLPGEPLFDIGNEIKADAYALGFDELLLFGYSNHHMGYFTNSREYDLGGYESLLSFWGEDTGERVRNGAVSTLKLVMM